ncbi:MAG: hypothetical protein M3Q48_03745 [Actinomycetota bacterium]|nr:hypothetical protein [Actinomycetota bacterium]
MKLDLATPLAGPIREIAQRARRRLAVGAVAVFAVLASAAPAWADAVTVDPTADGLSFGVKIQKMLNWGGQIALWASLASILAGAGAWGLSKHFGNYGGAHKGMQLVLGGAIGALVVASAGPIVNSMFGG